MRYPDGETLVRREAESGFCTILDCLRLQAELMEHSSPAQGKTQTKGVCTLLRQRQRFVAAHQPLVWIAKIPQRPGGVGVTNHPRVLPMLEHSGAVLRGVVEGYALRKMGGRRGWLSHEE